MLQVNAAFGLKMQQELASKNPILLRTGNLNKPQKHKSDQNKPLL